MFSVFISYFLSLFIVFIQIFFLAGGFIVFSTNLHILSSVIISFVIYVFSFTYVIPAIVLSRIAPRGLEQQRHPVLFNTINQFYFVRNRPSPKVFASDMSPFIMIGGLAGSRYIVINSLLLKSLSAEEISKYLKLELLFNESFTAKIMGHVLIVLLFWRGIFSWLFNLCKGDAVFRYIFVVPRRLFNYLSNSYKSVFFRSHQDSDIRGIAQKVIYLENANINRVHFNVSSTTMWSISKNQESYMDERFHQSELL